MKINLRKSRVFIIVFIMMIFLTACNNSPSITLDYNDKYITIYSPTASTIELEIILEYPDGQTTTFTHVQELQAAQIQNIMLQELHEDLTEGKAKLILVTLKEQIDSNYNKEKLLIAAICVPLMLYIALTEGWFDKFRHKQTK